MNAPKVKFGEFELDVAGYELTCCGRPVKLERIPMELLLLLVERGGQLVPRDEIFEKLWGKDVFVDVDNSINAPSRKSAWPSKMTPKALLSSRLSPGRGTGS